MLSTCPVSRLSKTITSSPCSIKRSTRCDPKNPAPPVISTLIFNFLNFLTISRQLIICKSLQYSRRHNPEPSLRVPGKSEEQGPHYRRALIREDSHQRIHAR